MILCREHALHHILICTVSGQRGKRRADERQIVYSLSRMLRTFSQKLFSASTPLEKNRQSSGWLSAAVTPFHPPGMVPRSDQMANKRSNMMQA